MITGITSIYIGSDNVQKAYIGTSLVYSGGTQPIDYSTKYFTTRSLANSNTITLTIPSAVTTAYLQTVSYSTDNGSSWTTVQNDSTKKTINVTVNSGDTILWKGSGYKYAANTRDKASQFSSNGNFEVEGNIMSLLFGDNFQNQDFTSANTWAFPTLFNNCTNLTGAGNLVLPAMTMQEGCYRELFRATNVATIPELPATTLAVQCYGWMFYKCSGVTDVSTLELPATTLANECYRDMFNTCPNLTKAPALNAGTVSSGGYRTMFAACPRLVEITCLATDISATDSTTNWVNGVASSGTFYKNASMTGWTTGISGIPDNWIVEDAV